MNNSLFETLIAPFTEKLVDPDNGSVTYKVTVKPKKITLILDETERFRAKGRKARRINTPQGVFLSILEASRRLNIPTQWLYSRCKGNKEGYSFIDNLPKEK
jgi:hypothetical protein